MTYFYETILICLILMTASSLVRTGLLVWKELKRKSKNDWQEFKPRFNNLGDKTATIFKTKGDATITLPNGLTIDGKFIQDNGIYTTINKAREAMANNKSNK